MEQSIQLALAVLVGQTLVGELTFTADGFTFKAGPIAEPVTNGSTAKPAPRRKHYDPEVRDGMVAKLDALGINHTLTFKQPKKISLMRYATQLIRGRDGVQQFTCTHLGDGQHQVRRIVERPIVEVTE